MDADKGDKPPDPPDLFEYTPILTIDLPNPNDNAEHDPMDAESASRKRTATSPTTTTPNPPKVLKKETGRQIYTSRDKGPYIVHVCLKDGETPNTVLHPIKFGMFLTRNNFSNILLGSVKRLGRNRISVEFQSHQDANSFLISPILCKNNYITSIPQYNVTRLGLVRDVPTEWNEDEVIQNIRVPAGCGAVIKARRMSRKVSSLGVTEWKPTQTVVLTFDGQILPKRVFCFYTALSVEMYMYPSIQCYNCCRFGHTRTVCRSKPRCFKCAQDHPGDGCQVSSDLAYCVSCTGNHYANDKACPELGRQKAIKALMAEKFISYSEASQVFPPVSRSYAEVSKISPKSKPVPSPPRARSPSVPSTQKSYRKTVSLKPKSHAPLSPSYDKQAHQALTQNYSFSASQNGCAYSREGATSPNQVSPQNILNIISSMLMTVLANPSQSLPDHVAKYPQRSIP